MTFARLHEAQVTERVDTALEIHRGSAEALAWVISLRDRVKVETAADVAVLANIAIGLSQQALEIEPDRQSDLDPMVAMVGRLDAAEDDAMLAQFEAMLRAENGEQPN